MAIISKLVYKGLKANLPTTRSADSFYLCTDTRELYFGDELYTESVRFYNGAANKPATPAQGVLYIDEATGKGEAWDGTAWKPVITPVTVSAGDNSVEIGGTATASTVKAKLSTKEGNQLQLVAEAGKEGLFVPAPASADSYKIEEAATAETGYLKTYVLNRYANGDETGTAVECGKINIPKDYLVKSAEIKEVATADDPYTGAKVGDKYIDFVINVKSGTATDEHVYLPVNDLVDVYTAGNGIDISAANEISVKIDTANANGLGVGADGVKLDVAVANDNTGANGKAGAMSAADKTDHDAMVAALTIGTF